MVNSNTGNPVQAVPLIEGKVNLGVGVYEVSSLIHCEQAGDITFGPNQVPYSMLAGDDRAFSGVITVLAGCTVTID